MRVLDESELYWWKNRWWAAEEHVRVFKDRISKADVDSKIDKVARVFDVSWGKRVGLRPVHASLLSQGLIPLQFLVSFGGYMEAVEGVRRDCVLAARLAGMNSAERHRGRRDE